LNELIQQEKIMRDYYQILGISHNASLDEIKAAYRKKANENHPDKGGTNEKMRLS
jgi:DnaJ homolog subfamily C member 3